MEFIQSNWYKSLTFNDLEDPQGCRPYPQARTSEQQNYRYSNTYQISKVARERDAKRRAEYIRHIAQYLPHERVYVDESRFDRRVAIRNRAWALCGSRAVMNVFFLRGSRCVRCLHGREGS